MNKLDLEKLEKLKTLLMQGKTLSSIARDLNCSITSIRNICMKHNLMELRDYAFTNIDMEKLKDEYMRGTNVTELAYKYDIDYSLIKSYIARNKLAQERQEKGLHTKCSKMHGAKLAKSMLSKKKPTKKIDRETEVEYCVVCGKEIVFICKHDKKMYVYKNELKNVTRYYCSYSHKKIEDPIIESMRIYKSKGV